MSDSTSSFAGYPAMPGEPDSGQVAARPAPPSVLSAVKLMFVRAGLTVLSLLLLIVTRDSLRQQIMDNQPGVSQPTLDTALTVAIGAGVVFGIVFAVLYALLAQQVRKGKNWARIVTFVVAGLALLGAVGTLAQPAPTLSRLLALVIAVLDVAVIVLLTRRPSGEYFRTAR